MKLTTPVDYEFALYVLLAFPHTYVLLSPDIDEIEYLSLALQ